ncbi:uncharacterized protein LOC135394417 isoform X2 [Ornithodoros turicata]|uniref:uncharacterized protein LOC135394417 isoform X2 n=1 Tax=Ornithodoros turicata TaxID=34597 RepID=UPI003139B570
MEPLRETACESTRRMMQNMPQERTSWKKGQQCQTRMGFFDETLFLKDRPSIQTMASASFTLNSIILMLSLFAAMSSDDAAVQLKLNAVDSTPEEIRFTSYGRIVACYINILVDLFLVIGIEDNCRAAMVCFMWWNWFHVFVDTLTLTGFAIWKGTSDNAFCARRVYFYSLAVQQGEIGIGQPPDMAIVREKLTGPVLDEVPRRPSDDFIDDNVEPDTMTK